MITCFLVSLLWRVPLLDGLVKSLMRHVKNNNSKENTNLELDQITRFGLIPHTLSEIVQSSSSISKWEKLHEVASEIFVLGVNASLRQEFFVNFGESVIGVIFSLLSLSRSRVYSFF